MENSVREFASEQPDADYAAVVERLGPPEKIAESFILEMDAVVIVDNMRVRRDALYILLVGICIFLTVWVTGIVLTYIDHEKDMNGYAVVEVIEISDAAFAEGDNEK